ncbi:MAG: ATP-binding protein [Chloroflexi bacterium]|nr:ATP-binding protein [Chloroflexota bacterium]
MRLPFSLRVKLLASFLFVLLPIFGILIADFRVESERDIEGALDEQMRIAQTVGAVLDTTFDEAIAVGTFMASQPVAQTFDTSQLDPYLQSLAPLYPQYERINVYDIRGWNAGTSLPYSPGASRASVADRPYFQEVLATNTPAVSEVLISRRTFRPAIAAAVPIRDDKGQPVGVVSVTLVPDLLARKLAGVPLAPGQDIFTTDHKARAAFDTRRQQMAFWERDYSRFPSIQQALSGKPVRLRSFLSPIGDVRLGALATSPKYGWVVGATLPVEEALAHATVALRLRLLSYSGLAVLALGLASLLAWFLVSPLKQLTAQAIAIGKGELSRRVTIATGDEMERLGTVFNEMAARLEITLDDLGESNAQLKAILTATDHAVVMEDLDGRIGFLNKRMEEWFGLQAEDVLGQKDEVMATRIAALTRDPEAFLQRRRYLSEHATAVLEEEVELVRPTPRIFRLYAAPVYSDGQLLGRIEHYSDITEHRRLERLRDEFLSMAAHELKTPVASIKGYTQLLQRWAPEGHDPREGKILKIIDRQSDRLSRLVQELLEVSRLQLGRMELRKERIDLVKLAKEVVEGIAPTTDKHHLLFQGPASAIIEADRNRLEQVLINLLDNAIRYSPEGGDIETRVMISEDEAIVAVRDRGVGIPKERQERIFEQFYRAHAGTPYDFGGMGVGLYISRQVVERHNGRIRFESEEGKGSTFYFSLPLSRKEN